MIGQHEILLDQGNFRGVSGSSERSGESFRVHDYTDHQPDVDYAFEPAGKPNQSYITGWGKGIKLGDRLLLQCKGKIRTYWVKKIDYYADPSNMWIALLEDKQD
jgi:hypothetical protein